MAGGHVLVADDDASIRDLLRMLLSRAGFTVHQAHDGLEAVEIIRARKLRGVVLDINMPVLDGFDVLEVVAAEQDGLPPVLMLTARHSSEDVRRALALGARDYLTKPFTEHQLCTRLKRLLPSPYWDGRAP